MKTDLVVLGYIIGDEIFLLSYVGILIRSNIRIPIKQPVFHGKYIRPAAGFFRGSLVYQ